MENNWTNPIILSSVDPTVRLTEIDFQIEDIDGLISISSLQVDDELLNPCYRIGDFQNHSGDIINNDNIFTRLFQVREPITDDTV